MTAETLQIFGSYVGRSRVRDGMESSLTPVERKRIAKSEEKVPLRLNEDGTFNHKKTTSGRFEIKGDKIICRPEEFNGASLRSMKQAAEQAGRFFGLAWLFDPFELEIRGDALICGQSSALVYTEYLRT